MARKGELLLKAKIDTKGAADSLRGLLTTITKENEAAARTNARFKTALVRESLKQDELQARSSTRVATELSRLRTQEAKQLRELANLNKAEAQSVLANVRAHEAQEKVEKRRERERKPKPSAFANAVYSTRINLPGGAAPLVGRSLAAAGLDLTRKSTLAIGAGIAGIGTAVDVARPVLTFLDDAAKKASDLNESVNKSQVIFKSSSKTIEAWGDTTADAIGQTKRQAVDAAATFGNLLNQAGFNLDQSAKNSISIVERATDLSSLFNTEVDDALQSLQSGLVGESEPLRKYGIFLSEARVQAEAFALGLGKVPPNAAKVKAANEAVAIATFKASEATKKYGAGSVEAAQANGRLDKANQALEKSLAGSNSQLTDQQKIQARLSIIMKDSAVAQGDFAKTSGEAANAQRQLNAQIEELQTKIGQDTLPAKKAFLQFFRDGIGLVGNLYTDIHTLVDTLSAADAGGWGLGDGLQRVIASFRTLLDLIHLTAAEARFQNSAKARATDLPTLKNALTDLQSGKLSQEDAQAAQALLIKRGIIKKDDITLQRAAGTPQGQSTGILGAARPDMFGTETQARKTDAMAALMRGITAATNDQNAYINAEKRQREAGIDNEIDRRIQQKARTLAVNQPGIVTGTNGGNRTGNGFTAGGGLYSGAGRNAAAAKARREAEKAQKAAEAEQKRQQKAAEKAAKEARKASEKLLATVLKGDIEAFKATVDSFKTVPDADGLNELTREARRQSKAIKDAEVNAAQKRYDDAAKRPGANLKALKIARLTAFETAKQNFDKREDQITDRKLDGFKRIETETEKQARIAEKQTEDDIREYEERQKNYRLFLDAEERTLQSAQDEAMRRGDFARSTQILQSQLDNRMRQLVETYRDDLQNAGGDPNAIAAAGLNYRANAAEARRQSDAQAADNVLFGTSNDLKYGAKNAIERLFQDSANGTNTLDALSGTFADLGQVAGSAWGDYMNRRLVSGPLERYFDKLSEKLAAGGQDAGYSIMLGANTLANAASLLSASGKKKSGGILGGILGGVAGFFLGGPAGAMTGFNAGSQLGQGNILGAGMSILGGVSGGAFSKGGVKIIGGGSVNTLRTSNFPMKGYAAGGYPVSGRKAWGGEFGTELMFGDSGQVTALGVGGYANFTPSGRNVVLPTETSQKLVRAAAGMATGDSARSGGGNTYVQFFGDVSESMHLEQIERERERKMRNAALVS